MALIKCPECGKEISDKALVCPNCGCPMRKQEEAKAERKTNQIKVKKKTMAIIASIVALLAIGTVIFVIISQPKSLSKLVPFGISSKMNLEQLNKSMERYGFQYVSSSTSDYSWNVEYSAKEVFGLEPKEVSITIMPDSDFGRFLYLYMFFSPGDRNAKKALNNLISQFGEPDGHNLGDNNDETWGWKDNKAALFLYSGPNTIYIDCYEGKNIDTILDGLSRNNINWKE